MDNHTNSASVEESQADLAPSDRKLLLKSTLGLFLRRLNHNIPVTARDVISLAPYADPEQVGASR